ncbi:DJ-1/PfpI family protein [Bacillus luti]|uniref:DJ-1 family protein n=1 Tax=Bacillus luti TaxID=2026191 RepID=A0A7V7S752_9BACI|nr:DJ-1/PfpI family protein [Bacillus luti]KAB2442556.1 DJ-1 family protein [Bacillus luti]
MTKKALFIIPPERFNEDELFQPKEILEAAGIQVTIASTIIGEITGDYEGKANSTIIFSDVPANRYDLVAIIGGSGTIDHLWGNQLLINFLKEAYDQKVLLTGICAGSVVVSQTGLLSGRKATCYPVDVMIHALKANNVEYIAEHVIAHDDIITSNGPEGAVPFGESIVKALQ